MHDAISSLPPAEPKLGPCWLCEYPAVGTCSCRRPYCEEHHVGAHCVVCSVGYGLLEKNPSREPVSELVLVSLAAAAGDPYIVVPPALQEIEPLPLVGVERLIGAMIQVLQSNDPRVRLRAVKVLAATTNAWPTLNPSQLAPQKYSTSLIVTDQVRQWLMYTLKHSKLPAAEPVALAILDKLRTADFRDLYPRIEDNLKLLRCGNSIGRVRDVCDTLGEFYPLHRFAVDERCEICVYEQYMNKHRGAGDIMERLYGPRLRLAPNLSRMLKKGVRQSNYDLFLQWYPGQEDEYL